MSNASYSSNLHAVGFHPEEDTRAPPYKAIAKRQQEVPLDPGLDLVRRLTEFFFTAGATNLPTNTSPFIAILPRHLTENTISR